MTGDELDRLKESWKASEQAFVDDVNEKFRRHDLAITALLQIAIKNGFVTAEEFARMIVANTSIHDQATAYFRDKKEPE